MKQLKTLFIFVMAAMLVLSLQAQTKVMQKDIKKAFKTMTADQQEALLKYANRFYERQFLNRKELSNNLVENSIQKELNFIDDNYKIQAKPRSVNIFYMIDGLRERIENNNNEY